MVTLTVVVTPFSFPSSSLDAERHTPRRINRYCNAPLL